MCLRDGLPAASRGLCGPEARGGQHCGLGSAHQHTRSSPCPGIWTQRESPGGLEQVLPVTDEALCRWKPGPPLPTLLTLVNVHGAAPRSRPGLGAGDTTRIGPRNSQLRGIWLTGQAERRAEGMEREGRGTAGQGGDPGCGKETRVLLPAWWVRPCRGSLLGPSPAALKAEMLTRYLVWLVRFFSFAVVSGRNSTLIFSVSFRLSASQ